jgi:hypothetical protein
LQNVFFLSSEENLHPSDIRATIKGRQRCQYVTLVLFSDSCAAAPASLLDVLWILYDLDCDCSFQSHWSSD